MLLSLRNQVGDDMYEGWPRYECESGGGWSHHLFHYSHAGDGACPLHTPPSRHLCVILRRQLMAVTSIGASLLLLLKVCLVLLCTAPLTIC
eukprot:COSAG05_NODE_180_length_14817_cov_423.925262_15_plen_91_part_00